MKFLITAMLVGSSAAVFAQSNALGAVQGNVTVTSGGSTAKADSLSALKNGDLISVSSGASTTVNVGNCSVPLSPGQSLVVNTALACEALKNTVKTIPVNAGTGGGVGGGLGGGLGGGAGSLLTLGAVVAGAGAIASDINRDSPTTTPTPTTPTPTPTPTPAVTQQLKPSGN